MQEGRAATLLGARQVGKTTLARQLVEEWNGPATVFDLETAAQRDLLARDAEQILGSARGLVVLDEVQRLPRLFETLRPLCDRPGRPATFLLLGSASPTVVRGVSESLTGRIRFVDMSGLSVDEVGPDERDRLRFRGGFPDALLAESDEAWARTMESYSRAALERELPLLNVRLPSAALTRFWLMLAHFHGRIWNAAEVGRAMDASPGTANRYRDLLAGVFLARVLPPWWENLGKRLVKSPRIYVRDSGLLHSLLGIGNLDQLQIHPRRGASWEGFALEQTLIAHGGRDAFFYRTQ